MATTYQGYNTKWHLEYAGETRRIFTNTDISKISSDNIKSAIMYETPPFIRLNMLWGFNFNK